MILSAGRTLTQGMHTRTAWSAVGGRSSPATVLQWLSRSNSCRSVWSWTLLAKGRGQSSVGAALPDLSRLLCRIFFWSGSPRRTAQHPGRTSVQGKQSPGAVVVNRWRRRRHESRRICEAVSRFPITTLARCGLWPFKVSSRFHGSRHWDTIG